MTGWPVRTSTPSRSRSRRAASRSRSGRRSGPAGPASISRIRAELGSKCRKSRASDWREISASAPAISTPVGPPPMTTKVSSARRRVGVGFPLGALERHQHAAPDVERILERLQARRGRAPLVVPEIRVRRASRDDQVVVVEHAVREREPLRRGVDRQRRRRAAPRRCADDAGSIGSARRCRQATAPPSRPDTAAAGRRDDCAGRPA